jgi:1-acyl-sn-glycerol-3-phosphate acyltransferase
MSDLFYDLTWTLCYPIFMMTGDPVVIGQRLVQRRDPYILAVANHQSPFDVPLIMANCHRRLDFVSITEVFKNPFMGAFYGSMNAFPLDRSRRDSKTVRVILDRLERGRAVCMFPEGSFRTDENSVLRTRKIKPGVGRIANLANVPVVPCVITGSREYLKVSSWRPAFSVRYGLIFGKPIEPTLPPPQIEKTLVDDFVSLHATLREQMRLCARP